MSVNPASILDSTKKLLGFESEYTAYDVDITIFVNSAFSTLKDMGIGPETGFLIVDNSALWSDYISRQDLLGMVQHYVYLSTRLVFDPPTTSFGISAIEKMLEQFSWRILVAAEKTIQLPDSNTIKMDSALASFFTATVYDNTFVDAPANPTDKQELSLKVKIGRTGQFFTFRHEWEGFPGSAGLTWADSPGGFSFRNLMDLGVLSSQRSSIFVFRYDADAERWVFLRVTHV